MSDSQGRSDKNQRVHNVGSSGSSKRAAESVTAVTVTDGSDRGDCNTPHNTAVEEDQDVERNFAP